jgi:hypothetical protein
MTQFSAAAHCVRHSPSELIGTIMRTLSCLPLAIALASTGAIAAPQTTPQTAPNEAAMTAVQVHGQVPYRKLWPEQIQQIKGVYVFDNGAMLKISDKQRRLYAQLGERAPTEMVPLAENLFTSPDQRMTMRFESSPFGDVVVLTYPVDLDVADSAMVTLRVALR